MTGAILHLVAPFFNHQKINKMENIETRLSRQEMEDIKLAANADIFNDFFSVLPEERKTELVCLAAIQANCMNFSYVPEKYRTDQMIINVLQKAGGLLYDVAENRRTPEMYATAIESNGRALMYFPPEMITPDAAMKAVHQNGTALEFVPEALKTPEICHAALNCKKSRDYDVIRYVPFPDVCYDYLKKMDGRSGDPFMVFGNIKTEVITPEMAQLAVKTDPSCLQFVPDRMKTSEMCVEAVEKDWMNMRFVPENMRNKPLCEIAMNFSIHAQQLVPEKWKTLEMYVNAMRKDGMNLQYVPEKFKTPEICLQAVISVPAAGDFVPERYNGGYNIYDFYHGKLNDNFLLTNRLSFEQVQKVFNGDTLAVSGMNFAKNVTLQDFTINYDRKTHQINIKALNDAPKKKKTERNEHKPGKRKGMKM